MSLCKIEIYRDIFSPDSTGGRVFINGKFFGYSLEDPARPANVKIHGQTAIGEGIYSAQIVASPKFGTVLGISNVVGFTHTLFHGGNKATDTEGCILIAKNRLNKNTIQGTLKSELVNAVKGFKNIFVHVYNVSNWEAK